MPASAAPMKKKAKLKRPSVLREVKHLAREFSHVGREVERSAAYSGRKLYKHGRMLGPGLIAGAADDDAGGIATYSIAGAQFGYGLSWLLVLSTPLLIAVQSICARIGNVTKKGLAALIRERYGKKFAIFAASVLIIANVAIIAADVAGMSVAVELLTNIPWYWFVLPLSAIILYLVVYKNFATIERWLIYFSLGLVAYIIAGFLSKPDWAVVLKSTLVPHIEFSAPFLMAAVGLLGTTITPYLFFWQTATEIEAKRTEKQHKRVNFDIFTGMIYSNLISYFIILTTATELHPLIGKLGAVDKAADPVRFIAEALRPVAGDYCYYLFAVGLFAASVLAVIVLASSTAYVASETLGWKKGLNKKVKQARGFYTVLTLSVIAGIVILATGLKPIDAMYYSQILAGVLDPILLVIIVKLATDKTIMGDHAITGWRKWGAWISIAVIGCFVLFLFWSWGTTLLGWLGHVLSA